MIMIASLSEPGPASEAPGQAPACRGGRAGRAAAARRLAATCQWPQFWKGNIKSWFCIKILSALACAVPRLVLIFWIRSMMLQVCLRVPPQVTVSESCSYLQVDLRRAGLGNGESTDRSFRVPQNTDTCSARTAENDIPARQRLRLFAININNSLIIQNRSVLPVMERGP